MAGNSAAAGIGCHPVPCVSQVTANVADSPVAVMVTGVSAPRGEGQHPAVFPVFPDCSSGTLAPPRLSVTVAPGSAVTWML